VGYFETPFDTFSGGLADTRAVNLNFERIRMRRSFEGD
jgi:hypothetical protein